ncbi:MAG: GAF domain-containing sensor histidine kinase, partial [Thermoanaerobaculia bacterium]|nr:GAF domain-containing sensor histidine kinase [Thermoanaerobaculia bacterium]
LIFCNNVIMFAVMGLYGYSSGLRLQLISIDSSIYLLILPFSIVVALSYPTMGPGAVLALAFTGIVMNMIARSLALARAASEWQVRRLASLTAIGKTISLRFTRDEFLHTIYSETQKVIEAEIFSVTLFDERKEELRFEIDVVEDEVRPKTTIPLGEGLNSWVVRHEAPLLLNSLRQEKNLGLMSVEDGLSTESWLGVPMIARDRVIGVISVQSYRKNAFSTDDLMLMTAIANQAAVALESAQLYSDLEGLTYALERRVAERTYDLREANLRLMAADRSKNQFLANMSHELRTPLNSIIGFSSVLLQNARTSIEPRLYKFLENIHAAGTHLLALINDILDLSKIEAGRMELRLETFDIRDTITSVRRVMKGFATDAGIEIRASVDDDVPPVTLDEGRLKQILFNLLSNAVKFSPGGGPVALAASFVDAEGSPLGVDTIRLRVSDRGIGIEEKELERIFDQFYQTGSAQRAARRGGTGLGLSLTKNFVELHRGIIDVESKPGEGATFTIDLPLDARAAGADSDETDRGIIRGSTSWSSNNKSEVSDRNRGNPQ